MALAIQPFSFNYAPGRVTGVQSIDKPTWGPPDVSQLAFQGLSQLLPNAAKAYQGVQQQMWKERGLQAAGNLDFGAATALGQPGGPYAQPSSNGTQTVAPNVTAGGKLPTFARVEGNAPSAEIGGLISSTAATHALAPDYLTKLVQIESNGDPNAFNKGSKASGLGQFIPSTWKQYGGGASPFDPGANLDATARLTIDNAKVLRNALGREPTQGELYLAHQQGAGNAAKLLSNPDARAFDVVPPRNVVSNLPGALRGQASGMTAGQFASLWTNRFGDAGSAFAAAPQQAAAAGAGRAVAPVTGDNPAQLRAEAQAYAQTNPEAARQMLARADAAEAAAGGGQAPAAPPNPAFTSLGGQQRQMQLPQMTPGSEPAITTGPSLFATQPQAGAPAMTLPPEAQQPAVPAPAQPAPQPAAAPAAPVPPAVQTAQALSPAVAAAPQPVAPIAPPPAQPQQNAAVMRQIVQAAIGSGDPTLQALAGQFLQQQQPGYKFLEAGGNVYRTDARGNIEPVVRGAGAGRFATLAPGDPRRPEGFRDDPRTLQVDLSTGKVEPIEGPKEGRGANNDQILRPGDPARAALNIPEDGRSWRVRSTDNGKREIGPIDNPTDKESPTFKQETTLRGEFDTKVKDYRSLRGTYEDMQSAIREPSASGDISMIFSFMKMLDPTSVVREGEYATAANSGGVGTSVMNLYNKLLTGERLTPEQRAEFANRAGRMLERSHNQAKKDEERYRELATKQKLDPDNVAKLPEFKFQPVKPNKVPAATGGLGARDNPVDVGNMSQSEIEALPRGTYIRKGGRLGVVE